MRQLEGELEAGAWKYACILLIANLPEMRFVQAQCKINLGCHGTHTKLAIYL